ncbi:VirD4-like conjugal transfer protein, CD1115 family [Streptococcus sobrinus]|uniref:VirD4-like conjugal transfer protein, CD1115 family n=1 Tax=Streptococcus sobrinus TaxID=1310 RepID=UPI0002DB6ADD|nr:type IV secretory system conjugative DNA transfer family protein [Streptococcus sobrinus]
MIGVKRKFWPFGVLGLLFAGLSYRLVALFLTAPRPTGVVDILKATNYTISHYLQRPYFIFVNSPFAWGAAGFGFLIALVLYARFRPGGTHRTGEESGSARFATAKELKPFEDKIAENNIIYTKHARMGLFNSRLPYDRQLNKNVVVFGPPGSGKTFTYVKPNMMQMNGSYIVTDPKGLLVHEVGQMLAKHNYKIKVFDLVTMTNSNTINPFKYMRSELDIDRISEAIVDGTKKSDNQGENFWVQANLLLTRALIGYLYFDSQKRGYTPNLTMVPDLLRNIRRVDEKVPSPTELMFEDLEKLIPGNYACRQWNLFNSNFEAETRTSVLAVMSAQYSVFDHEAVADLVSSDSLEMETWNTEKTAVFIAIPETNKAFNFLASTLFAVMFDQLTHQADEIIQGKVEGLGKDDLLHIRVIIDEIANIGRIPNFIEVLASVRSREISVEPIWQALGQAKALYPKDWETLMNNCDSTLFLGTNDVTTMEYFSKRSGRQTIVQTNYSESGGRHKSGTTSYQTHQRDLMTPDEIARIGVGEALLFISKQNVFRDKRATVNDHPMKKYLSDNPDDGKWYKYYHDMKNQDIAEFTENVNWSLVVDEDEGFKQFLKAVDEEEESRVIDSGESIVAAWENDLI